MKSDTSRKLVPKTGELLVDEGLVNPADIQQALAIQEQGRASLAHSKSRLFGMILCDLNLITPTDNYCVLEKHGKLITLADVLIQKKLVSRSLVEETLARSKAQNIPFMSLLLEDGIIPKTLLQQIVFDLFHIPFRSISDIVFSKHSRTKLCLVIDKSKAREHKVIPLVLKGNTLLCGITDPQNLGFIRKLNTQFPQYRFKTVFISFSGFTWFYKMLYEEAWVLEKSKAKTVDLSLLLKFRVTIADPVKETQAVLDLYKRYEQTRSLVGFSAKGERQKMFQAFVTEYHGKIRQKYHCRAIEFSLKKEKNRLQIMAFPKDQVS
jgi:hypothetical protein